ncbi:hypothetical protein Tco_0645627 [Tanacetum coccineum]
MVEHAEFDESNTHVLERFYTSAGNHVKEILLKLNLPDHRKLKDGGEGLCDLPIGASSELSHKIDILDTKVETTPFSSSNVITRTESVKLLADIDHRKLKDLRQKAKLKWAVEVTEPVTNKNHIFNFFSNRFKEDNLCRPSFTSNLFKHLSSDDVNFLECPFKNLEIKDAVWNCEFETSAHIPRGSNSSFITLLPKVDDPLVIGLPIGAKMSRCLNWNPLVDQFYKRLSKWKSKTLSFGGRLTLLKSVLGSLGVYYFSTFKAPKKIISKFEGPWYHISKLKEDLITHGIDLLFIFKRKIENALSSSFWHDNWLGGSPIFETFLSSKSFFGPTVSAMGLVHPPGLVFHWAWRRELRYAPEIAELGDMEKRYGISTPTLHKKTRSTNSQYTAYSSSAIRPIVLNDASEATLSCGPTVSPLNDNEMDFRISFDKSDDNNYTPEVSYSNDLDYFKDFENEFPAIVYNDALTSKLYFLTEPPISPQHIDEFNLKDETSLSECDEEEHNVLYFNDLFPFNVIYPDDLKLNTDNNNKIEIKRPSGDMSVTSIPDVINVNAQGSNKLSETSHDTSNKFFKTETFIKKLNFNIVACNYLNNGILLNLIKNLYVPFGIPFDLKLFYKDGVKLGQESVFPGTPYGVSNPSRYGVWMCLDVISM